MYRQLREDIFDSEIHICLGVVGLLPFRWILGITGAFFDVVVFQI